MDLRGLSSVALLTIVAKIGVVGLVAGFLPRVFGAAAGIQAFCVAFLGDGLFGLWDNMQLQVVYDLNGEEVIARAVALGLGGAVAVGLVVVAGYFVFRRVSGSLVLGIPAFVLADLAWRGWVGPFLVHHFGLAGAYPLHRQPDSVRLMVVPVGVTDVSALSMSVCVGLGLGLLFLLLGWVVRSGGSKRYFLVRGSSAFWGPANYHFLPALGVLLCLFGLSALAPDAGLRRLLLSYAVPAASTVALGIGLWHPAWLKPKWIRQLKDNHADIYPFLREAAQEEAGNDPKKAEEWSAKMDTVEGQNEWVAEVRKRLGMSEPRIAEATERK